MLLDYKDFKLEDTLQFIKIYSKVIDLRESNIMFRKHKPVLYDSYSFYNMSL